MSIKVSEMFYSIQGEGPTMGKPAVFLRLQSCNLMCGGQATVKDKKLHDGATWRCDTIETWMVGKEYTENKLYDKFKEKGFMMNFFKQNAHLIITGGEPMLQQIQLLPFLAILPNYVKIEVETNGTIKPTKEFNAFIDQYNVSPKLSNSGMPQNRRYKGESLTWHKQSITSFFKFVVTRKGDIAEIFEFFIKPLNLSHDKIYLMPGAENREQLIKNSKIVAELCKEYGFNFSTRLQIDIWNKCVGV